MALLGQGPRALAGLKWGPEPAGRGAGLEGGLNYFERNVTNL